MNFVARFSSTPLRAALAAGGVALATIVGAWIFQWAGYAPCDLCLMQRWAYYAGIPLAGLTALAALASMDGVSRMLLIALALVFAGSAVFGVYHSGVEWGFWPGPTGCSGVGVAPGAPADMGAFLNQLKTARVVSCTDAALRIFGLSLAGWNAVISAALCGVALRGRAAC